MNGENRKPVILIKNLSIEYKTGGAGVKALRCVNLAVNSGEAVAIAGESGCGKSTLANSLLMIAGPSARVTGSVILDGSEVTAMDSGALAQVRGKKAGMIFQDPCASLNPLFTVKEQIIETIEAHEPGLDKGAMEVRTSMLLLETGLEDVKRIEQSYPHQLSGGQQQRVMAAIALSCNPRVLIADEPTTALDVTVQAQIMKMLARLREERNLTLILITHDLHLALEAASRLIVMYAGEVVEDFNCKEGTAPMHPYTEALFSVIPGRGRPEGARFNLIPGELPDMTQEINSCSFYGRCAYSKEKCGSSRPDLIYEKGRGVRCFYPLKIL